MHQVGYAALILILINALKFKAGFRKNATMAPKEVQLSLLKLCGNHPAIS